MLTQNCRIRQKLNKIDITHIMLLNRRLHYLINKVHKSYNKNLLQRLSWSYNVTHTVI